MLEGLTNGNLIDIGFVAFVTIACWSAMNGKGGNSSGSDKRHSEWKKELGDLKHSLETLIEEATYASQSLDRSLKRRQSELQETLERAEYLEQKLNSASTSQTKPNKQEVLKLSQEQEVELEQEAPKPAAKKQAPVSFDPDLPNPSWDVAPKQPAPSEGQSSMSEIDRRLSEAIEVSRARNQQEEQAPEELTLNRSIPLDPVAKKVAERLLSRGESIDSVAKKLELTPFQVEEIKAQIGGTATATAEESFPPLAQASAKTINNQPQETRQTSLGALAQIDREAALL